MYIWYDMAYVVYLALYNITLMHDFMLIYFYVQMNVIYSMCMYLNMKFCTLVDYIHDSHWLYYIQKIVCTS